MALSEQTAVVVSLATSLALLALLLACVYRRHYRRLADNFRVSLDRRELDLQLLEHRFKQQARPQSDESPWYVSPPSEYAPNSIPKRCDFPKRCVCDVCAMPPKRGRAAADETAHDFRRHKSATEEAFAELVCPITFSLPVDPVTAEDGNVYERSAIEEWLKQQLKSPVTNLAMGTKLLPALQVKNMIRTMVTSGALTGDKVDLWKLKLKEEEEVAEMLRRAEAGDGAAMFILGLWYENGEKGLVKDKAKTFEWYKKSHEAGDASGTCCLGQSYLVGDGVPKCLARGATLLSQAAEHGSQYACCNLGRAYAHGLWGFPEDETMARRYYSMVASAAIEYYSMVASAAIEDCTPAKEEAATWLREHPAA